MLPPNTKEVIVPDKRPVFREAVYQLQFSIYGTLDLARRGAGVCRVHHPLNLFDRMVDWQFPQLKQSVPCYRVKFDVPRAPAVTY